MTTIKFDNLKDASIGTNIGDSVTVNGQKYTKVAGEEGSGIVAKLVPVEDTVIPFEEAMPRETNTASAAANNTTNTSSGPGTKYIIKEGVISYTAQKIEDLDSASQEAIRSSDRHTINSDGTISFTDTDGSEQLMPVSVFDVSVDLSGISDDVLQKAADITYLSQNTGVRTTDMNAVYESLGLDPNDTMASVKKDAILKAAGYNPGGQKDFYGNNSAVDQGAQLLSDQWQLAPEEGGINDHGMNALWLSQQLGGNISSTAAYIRPDNLAATEEAQRQKTQNIYNQYAPNRSVDDELDIFEWGKEDKKDTSNTGSTGGTGATGTVNTGTIGGGTGYTGGIGSGTINTGPGFVQTPNIGVVTPIYGGDQTGLTEVPIPTYQEGLNKQQTQFQNRAAEMQQFYKPQTLEEQQAAGTAPAFQNVLYRNRFGMSMYIQHINGVPSQPIPPGYSPVQGFVTQEQTQGGSAAVAANKGGVIQGFNPGGTVNPAMNFKPGGTVVEDGGIFKIKYPDGTFSQGYDTAMNAKSALDMGTANLGLPDYGTYLQNQGVDMNLPGYDQDAYFNAYQSYLSDPATLQNIQDQQAAQEKEDQPPETGGINQDQPTGQVDVSAEGLAQAQRDLLAQATVAPGGAIAAAPTSYIDPNTYGTVVESTAGQALGTAPMVTGDQVAQIGSATTADVPQKIGAATYNANQAYGDVKAATKDMDAATSTGPTKTITAQEQKESSVSDLQAATGDAIDVDAPDARKVETMEGTSELISGTGVDQTKVGEAFGTGEVQAASVQDELAGLMQQFEGGETPAWAAGSMRKATQMLAERGLGASSMAGQAIIQAAMEAALPIAQIDAGNKQQMALFKAEQRAKFLQQDFDQAFQTKVMNAAKVSEIANMNFTAEQQIALENSKAANTMELQNLSNEQALVMAEAAALSQLDTQNLNNRQQAEVQNAQNFLQIDMANLANEQQTALFKQQSLISSILSDQAAANAAQQFNATSENQTNQFFANLAASVNQFNAAQINAMKQFNADEVNSLLEFNAGIQNQREMFNAQNYLVVAQANAQWRQNLATINTAAANESNMEYAQTVNALTLKTLDEIWQRERDIMDYSFTQSENAADRALSILLGDKKLEAIREQLDAEEQQALGSLMTKIFFSSDFKSVMTG